MKFQLSSAPAALPHSRKKPFSPSEFIAWTEGFPVPLLRSPISVAPALPATFVASKDKAR